MGTPFKSSSGSGACEKKRPSQKVHERGRPPLPRSSMLAPWPGELLGVAKKEPFWSETACTACPTLNRKGGRGKSGREPLYGDGRFIRTYRERNSDRLTTNGLRRRRPVRIQRVVAVPRRFAALRARVARLFSPSVCLSCSALLSCPLDARGARFHSVNCAARRELSSATSPLSVGPIARFDADCLCSVLSRLTTGAPPDRRRANRLYKTRKPSMGDLKMDGNQLGTIWKPRAASLDSNRDCLRPRQRRKTHGNRLKTVESRP